MKLVQRIAALMVLAALTGFTSAQAQETPNFDFFGHVVSVPTTMGGTLEMFSVLTNNGVVPTPIAMTWSGRQHTLVLRATLAGAAGFSQFYATGTVAIWTDVGPSTAADYANNATLEDGTAILTGVLAGTLTRNKFMPSLGNFVGDIDWTGGSRLGELGTNTTGWPIGGSISMSSLPSGYEETWDGKSDAPVGVAVEQSTWGAVKGLYRNNNN